MIDSVQEMKSMILSSDSKRVLEPPFPRNRTFVETLLGPFKYLAKSLAGDTGLSIKIYCDDDGKIDMAWEEFKEKMNANIEEKTISDGVMDHDLKEIRELKLDFDVQIRIDQSENNIADIPNIQEEPRKVPKDIKNRECKGKILTYCYL